MSDTPETKSVWRSVESLSAHHANHQLRQHAERLERERDEAIRILRVLKSDIDHMGHWLPDPCRKMVETFLSEKGNRNE
jgi:hypothetical protein